MSEHIKNKLINLIKSHIQNKGIVIWYDPKKIYEGLISEDDFKEVTFLKYKNSYYDLRLQFEKYFNSEEKPKLVIYIGSKKDIKNFPLIEIEVVSALIGPDEEYDFNTSLSLIVREILTGKTTDDNIKKISGQIEKGNINLEQAEEEIENILSSDYKLLYALFNSKDDDFILQSFLSKDEFDKTIIEKNAINEILDLFFKKLGIKYENIYNLEILKSKIIDSIFLTEFLSEIENDDINDKFSNIKLYKDNIKNINSFLRSWRKNNELNIHYITIANCVEEKYKLNKFNLELEEVLNCETFEITEKLIVKELLKIKLNNIDALIDIINFRKKSFWCKSNPMNQLAYEILQNGYILLNNIEESLNVIENTDISFQEYVEYYTGKKDFNAWYIIDKNYRTLNNKYFDFEFDPSIEEEIELFVNECRKHYRDYIEKQINGFISKFDSQKYTTDLNILRQNKIFQYLIEPLLSQNKKVAYYLIDAFRFEMGKEFYDSMLNYEERKIHYSLSGIPTITSIGMLNLFLQSSDQISITEKNNKCEISIKGISVNNRAERVSYLKNKLNKKIIFLKLEDVLKPKKSIKDQLKECEIAIITSQEIDSAGEHNNEIIVKEIMGKIFTYINRSINSLNILGFENFVITSDHGYLSGDIIGKDSKIEIPDGKMISMHKRVWMGTGGNNPGNTIRIKASELGFNSNLDFVFPVGYNAFKTSGEENNYIHGGISLQEMIIPVLNYYIPNRILKTEEGDYDYKVILLKDSITNRVFTLKVSFTDNKLFISDLDENIKRIKILIKNENKLIGQAEAAEYGFNDSNKEIILEKNKDNIITIILEEGSYSGNADIIILDAITEMELAKISNVKINLTI